MKKIKKIVSSIIVLTLVLTNLSGQYSTVFAKVKNNKMNHAEATERQKTEIIVKFKDKNTSEAIKNSTKEKLKLKKLSKKKKIKTKGERKNNKKEILVELLELDSKDDIKEVIKELKKNTDVEYAQPNYKLYTSTMPEDSRFNDQWALYNNGQVIGGQGGKQGTDINILKAWDITTGIKDVVVGILDTGIDIKHEDLEENIYINTNEIPDNGIDDDENGYIDDISGWDFFNEDNTVYDSATADKHGTHVAGIVAAEANGTGIRGVAPNIRILPLKFINGGFGYTSDAIEAIEYAGAMGIKIINCSWGSPEDNFALKETMDRSDILFVCAAGNNGNDVATSPIYPARFNKENIISVAATDKSGDLAPFSNYGQGVDIAAPGVRIISTVPENDYEIMSGTSMAAPHITGAAALILSINENEEVYDLKNRIISNSTYIETLRDKVAYSGIVNLSKIINSVSSKEEIENKTSIEDENIEENNSNNQDETLSTKKIDIPRPPTEYYEYVEINSLTSNIPSPQNVGTGIIWTCEAEVIKSDALPMSIEKDYSNDTTQLNENNQMINSTHSSEFITYDWEVYNGTQLVESNSTGWTNEYIWKPDEPGDYKVKVIATFLGNGAVGIEYSDIYTISDSSNPIDTVPPIVTADIQDCDWNNTDVTVTLSYIDDQSDIYSKQYELTRYITYPKLGYNWSLYTEPITLDSEGTWHLHYRAIDNAGNENIGYFGPYNIDKRKPEVSADLENIEWSNEDVVVNLTYTDKGGSDLDLTNYQWTNSTAEPTVWLNYQTQLTQQEEGIWYLNYKASDLAGNIKTGYFGPYKIDKTPPTQPSITVTPSEATNGDVIINIAYSSDSTIKQYKLGNGTWQEYIGAITVTANTVVYARGQDIAGNWSNESSKDITNIDRTPPTPPNIMASPSEATNGDVAVNITYSSDSTIKQYKLGNGTWQEYIGAITVTANTKIYARGQDRAGNWSVQSSKDITNIDKILPRVSSDIEDEGLFYGEAIVNLIFSDDESGISIKQYFWSKSQEIPSTWLDYNEQITQTSYGTWFLHYNTIDKAGNTITGYFRLHIYANLKDVRYEYDDCNRLIFIKDIEDNVINSFIYDNNGNLIEIISH